MQHQCFSHPRSTKQLETPQGVSSDSLGVGALEIRHKYAPDHWQCRQEALKHCLAMPTWFLHLWCKNPWQRGHQDPLCSFHTTPQQLRGRKCKNHRGGACTFVCSGTSHASRLVGLAMLCRGMLGECTADVEDTEKHFHVPATLFEVLSANRRCCRDMEAHFCIFHIGNVGEGLW